MGIYRSILREEELDAPILDDNNSQDLKDIEEIIADQDANAEEQDDAQDAEFGPSEGVDDILDEMNMIIAENMLEQNKIMMAIGIHEVNEASMGRQVVYEAADVKGYIRKAVDKIKAFFRKVRDILVKYLNKMQSAFDLDKKYAEKHKKDIEDGYSKYKAKNNEVKGYTYSNLKSAIDKLNSYSASEMLNVAKGRENDAPTADSVKALVDARVKRNFLPNVDPSENYADQLSKHLRGGSDEKVNIDLKPAEIYEIMTSGNTIKACKSNLTKVEREFKDYITYLNRKAADIKSSDDSNEKKESELAGAIAANNLITQTMNVVQTTRAQIFKAASARASQARKLAHAYVSANNKKESDKSTKTEASQYGFLSNLELV